LNDLDKLTSLNQNKGIRSINRPFGGKNGKMAQFGKMLIMKALAISSFLGLRKQRF
jgi:hypothetical protein